MITFATAPYGQQNHVLRNPDAPRLQWRTLCGRDASRYNTSIVDPDACRFADSAYTCQTCLEVLTRPETPK